MALFNLNSNNTKNKKPLFNLDGFDASDTEKEVALRTKQEEEAKQKQKIASTPMKFSPTANTDMINNLMNPILSKPTMQGAQTLQQFKNEEADGLTKKYNPIQYYAGKVSPTLGNIIGNIDTGIESALDSYTAGIGSFLGSKVNPEAQRAEDVQKEKFPTAAMIGSIPGYLGKGGVALGLEKLGTKLLGTAANTFKGKVASSVLGGAGLGLVEGATEGLKNNLGVQGTLNNMQNKATEYGLFGGGGAAAIGGIGKGISAIKASNATKQLNNALSKIDNGYNKYATDGIFGKTSTVSKPNPLMQPTKSLPFMNNTRQIPSQSTESILKPVNILDNINSPLNNIKPVKTQNIASNLGKDINAPSKPINFDAIKTIDDLPTDEIGLRQFIQETEKQIKNGLVLPEMNLQLFAEAQKRLKNISKVFSNTFEGNSFYTKAEKDMLNSPLADINTNERQAISESMRSAEQRLARNGIDAERQKIDSLDSYRNEDLHIAMGIMEDATLKARQTGDYTDVLNIAKNNVKKAGVEGGRLLNAFKPYKNTSVGKVVEASNVVDKFNDAVEKSNPTIKVKKDADTKEILKQAKEKAKKVNKDIESDTNTVSEVLETSFPKMLKNKITNALSPKTPEELGFIRTMINDLFGEAKSKIDFPLKPKTADKSIQTLEDAYKNRQYAGEIRTKAQQMLKDEFADNQEVLDLLDGYFSSKFKPPHSEGLLNKVINKRLDKGTITGWVKDFYATGRTDRKAFIDSIIKETGLMGDDALSLRRTLEARLKTATTETKNALLEATMKPKEKGIIKKATDKLTELTNIGLLENQKFTNRIQEKLSPIVKQLLKENNLTLSDIVSMSLKNRQDAKATLLRDVFKNTRVDDKEIVKLLDLVNNEFKLLTKQKQTQILEGFLKPKTTVKKTLIEKVQQKINQGVYDDEVEQVLRDAVKEKYGLPTLTNDDIKFITETMDSVQGLDDMSEAYLEGVAKVEKLILEKTPASLSQKVASGAFISMLGNFTSPLKNIVGNTLIALPEIGANPLARGIDTLISKGLGTGNKTVGKTDFSVLAKGAKQGIRSVKRDLLGGRDLKELKGKSVKEIADILANPINTDTSMLGMGDKFELGNRLAFDNTPGRIAENLVGTAMKIGDIPFNKAYFEDTLQQLMKSNRATEPTKDMIETSMQVSRERTYKDSNVLSDTALKVKNVFKPQNGNALKGSQKVKEAGQILVNSLIPFAKTPANIVKRGLEYSPIGLVEGGAKLLANKGNLSMMKQREVVDRLTRGTVGTSLLGAGYLLNKAGAITGAKDENFATERLKKESGILPDAIKVGNKTIDLKGLQPATTPLVAGSRLAKGDVKSGVSSAIGGITGALEQYTELPMLQGIDSITTLLSSNSKPYEKKRAFANVITALPKQYIPSIAKKLAYALDPFERDLGDGLVDNVVGKLPLVSKNYPTKVDLYGNNKLSYDGKNSLFNTLINPFVSKDIKDNKVSSEALRLNKSNIDGDLKNKVIPKEVTKDLGNIELTQEQQNKYQKLMGDKVINSVNKLLSDTRYGALPDNEKATLFSKALDIARDDAKTEMKKTLGVDMKKEKLEQKKETLANTKLYNQFKLKPKK